MKYLSYICSVFIFLSVSCSTNNGFFKNHQQEQIFIIYFDKIENSIVQKELNNIEMVLDLYNNYTLGLTLKIQPLNKNFDFFEVLESRDTNHKIIVKYNDIILSERWNSMSSYSCEFIISKDVVDIIKNIKSISVTEIKTGLDFSNEGNIDNIFYLNDNFISILYPFLNMLLNNSLIFFDKNGIDYIVEIHNEQYLYNFYISRNTDLVLFFEKDYTQKNENPISLQYCINGNKFKEILPKLLNEIGDPDRYLTSYIDERANWRFTNIFITLAVDNN